MTRKTTSRSSTPRRRCRRRRWRTAARPRCRRLGTSTRVFDSASRACRAISRIHCGRQRHRSGGSDRQPAALTGPAMTRQQCSAPGAKQPRRCVQGRLADCHGLGRPSNTGRDRELGVRLRERRIPRRLHAGVDLRRLDRSEHRRPGEQRTRHLRRVRRSCDLNGHAQPGHASSSRVAEPGGAQPRRCGRSVDGLRTQGVRHEGVRCAWRERVRQIKIVAQGSAKACGRVTVKVNGGWSTPSRWASTAASVSPSARAGWRRTVRATRCSHRPEPH